MMDIDKQLKEVEKLIQMDIDAIHAYDHAIDRLDAYVEIQNQLIDFRRDHESHVIELSDMCRKYGRTPPEFTKDFKGYLIEGLTAIRSSMGTESAIKAMRDNEKLTNHAYENKDAMSFNPEINVLVKKGLNDERRHLAYLERIILEKAWEKVAAQRSSMGAQSSASSSATDTTGPLP